MTTLNEGMTPLECYRLGILDAVAAIHKERQQQYSLARSAAEIGSSSEERIHMIIGAAMGALAGRVEQLAHQAAAGLDETGVRDSEAKS